MISVQDAWAQDEVAEQARGVQADLGWGLHPAHNGHGYATEAVGEVLRLCFDELRFAESPPTASQPTQLPGG